VGGVGSAGDVSVTAVARHLEQQRK